MEGEHARSARSAALLTDQLTEGFDALLAEYRILLRRHKQLEEQLEWAKQHHLGVLQQCSVELGGTPTKTAEDYLIDLEEAGRSEQSGDTDWLEILSQHGTSQRRSHAYVIKQAELACEKLKEQPTVQDTKKVEQQNQVFTNGAAGNVEVEEIKEAKNKVEPESVQVLERDFTVPGIPSKLNCPFAKVRRPSNLRHSVTSRRSSGSIINSHSNTRHSKVSSLRDPIEAEMCGAITPRSPAREENIEDAPTAVCPIRFLDQHKPEEVATYFEKHKHEIPRSHEVCIKRFQSNAEQIRQLDNKYGNLVSMIQGLGHKHQPLLPEVLDEEGEEEEGYGAQVDGRQVPDRIQNWANKVSASLQDGDADLPNGVDNPELSATTDDDRESRFDRPLKEVRVGESPSRPWGIQIPLKYQNAGSVASHESPATASPAVEETPAPKPKGCPFDHTKLGAGMLQPSHPIKSEYEEVDDPAIKSTTPQHPAVALEEVKPVKVPPEPTAQPAPPQVIKPDSPPAQMVFSGPVFIGYSPEQIKELFGGSLFNRS